MKIALKTGDFDILFRMGPDYQDPVTFLISFYQICLNNVNYNKMVYEISVMKKWRITGLERFKALVEAERFRMMM